MQVRGRAFEPGHFIRRHHLDHHRFRRRCVEGVCADKEQAHDQSREMADDRNGKPMANVSLQSHHTRCKSISPRRSSSVFHPRRLVSRIFCCFSSTCENVVTTRLDPVSPDRRLRSHYATGPNQARWVTSVRTCGKTEPPSRLVLSQTSAD
jgi:hypothetical protein